MANLNKVMLIGNLTRDPEVRYTPKGTAVTDIALAVNRIYSTDEGERREEATFVDVTLWGRQAEIAGQYMRCFLVHLTQPILCRNQHPRYLAIEFDNGFRARPPITVLILNSG